MSCYKKKDGILSKTKKTGINKQKKKERTRA